MRIAIKLHSITLECNFNIIIDRKTRNYSVGDLVDSLVEDLVTQLFNILITVSLKRFDIVSIAKIHQDET